MQASRTVLIIGDDPLVREPCRALLEAEGFAVVEVNNGAEAILWLQRRTVDLILLDLKMPVMDGRSFLEHRLRETNIRRVPVLVVSNWFDDDALRETLLRLGANHLLQKPLLGVELIGAVRELLTTGQEPHVPFPQETQTGRQDPRVAFSVPIQVRTGFSKETQGRLCDLSAGGLGMYLPRQLPSMGAITISLNIEGRSLTLKGFVQWTDVSNTPMGFRHGIQFTERQEDSFPLHTYSFFRAHLEAAN